MLLSLLSIRGLPDAAPSYSELFAEGCFAQRALCSGANLRKAARARGVSLPLFPRREVLEPLDRAGGFSPIGFLRTNYTPETTWVHPDPDLMVWREEQTFHAWETHGWRFAEDRHVNVSERYSPWQLLYLSEALDLRNGRIAVSASSTGTSTSRVGSWPVTAHTLLQFCGHLTNSGRRSRSFSWRCNRGCGRIAAGSRQCCTSRGANPMSISWPGLSQLRPVERHATF